MQDAGLLVEKINEDAKARSRVIIKAAEDEAEKILEEARADAKKIWDDMRSRASKDSGEEHRRIISNTMLENRKRILEAKQEMIQKAFELAADKIRAMRDDRYEKFITGLAVSLVKEKDAKIFVAYNDRGRLSPDFLDNINKMLRSAGKDIEVSYTGADFDINDGFVLTQGKYQVDVTLNSLIGLFRDDLEAEVVKILFDGIQEKVVT